MKVGAPERRLPRWSELAPLFGRRSGGSWSARRLAAASSISDLRRLALRRAPRAVFDYVDGAAGDEEALARQRAAFARVELRPEVLQDVATVETSVSVLGRPAALPLVCAPTGFTRMMHTAGESAVARVAGRAGIPYALSTMGTTSIEELAAVAPATRRWFQLYLWRDRGASRDFVERAAAAGYEALVLTVDSPVAGRRRRDVRNGLTLPPSLGWRTVLEGSLHPAWWFDLLTTAPLEFASLHRFDGTVAELAARMFDPAVTVDDLAWLRETWSGPLVVKGVQTAEDARRVVSVGADAIVVSNHGGRQLDRAPVPLEELGSVCEAVGGQAEVYADGGVLNGSDVVALLAAGARSVLVGRAYLFGLMAAGEAGAERAVEILAEELRTTLALLGVGRVGDLRPEHVRLRPG